MAARHPGYAPRSLFQKESQSATPGQVEELHEQVKLQ